MPGVRDGLPEKDTRRKEESGTKTEISHEKCLYPGDCPGSEESLRRESPGREYLQFGRTFQSLLSPWDTLAFAPESAVKRVLFGSGLPIGCITICSDGTSLCGLWMEGQKYFGGTIPSEMIPVAAESDPVLKATLLWLDAYRGPQPDQHHHPLPSSSGSEREPYWLRWWLR